MSTTHRRPRSLKAISDQIKELLMGPPGTDPKTAKRLLALGSEAGTFRLPIRITEVSHESVEVRNHEGGSTVVLTGHVSGVNNQAQTTEKTKVAAEVAAVFDNRGTVRSLCRALNIADEAGNWDTALAIGKTLANVLENTDGSLQAENQWWAPDVDTGRLDHVDRQMARRIHQARIQQEETGRMNDRQPRADRYEEQSTRRWSTGDTPGAGIH